MEERCLIQFISWIIPLKYFYNLRRKLVLNLTLWNKGFSQDLNYSHSIGVRRALKTCFFTQVLVRVVETPFRLWVFFLSGFVILSSFFKKMILLKVLKITKDNTNQIQKRENAKKNNRKCKKKEKEIKEKREIVKEMILIFIITHTGKLNISSPL